MSFPGKLNVISESQVVLGEHIILQVICSNFTPLNRGWLKKVGFFQFSKFSIIVGKNWNGENWDLAARGAKLLGNFTGIIWKNMGLGAIS